MKYDLDTTACAQRAICWYVKESLTNIEENRGTSFDHLINGVTRYAKFLPKIILINFKIILSSDYVHRMLSNTAWNSAINTGKQGLNCATAYSTCKLSPENLESFSNKLMKFARRK